MWSTVKIRHTMQYRGLLLFSYMCLPITFCVEIVLPTTKTPKQNNGNYIIVIRKYYGIFKNLSTLSIYDQGICDTKKKQESCMEERVSRP